MYLTTEELDTVIGIASPGYQLICSEIDYHIPVYRTLEEALSAKRHDFSDILASTKQMFMTGHNWDRIKSGYKTQTRRPGFRGFEPGVYWIRETAVYSAIKGNNVVVQYNDGTYSGRIAIPPDSRAKIKIGHKTPRGIMKCFARSFVLVTRCRKQRLQDISREDAIAEGIDPNSVNPIGDFIDLWDSIYRNKPGCSWSDNPLVSVLSIEYLAG